MTSFRIEPVLFDPAHLSAWSITDPRFRNWPVVYTLDGGGKVYVGESRNVTARFRQHLDSAAKRGLLQARVVVDETFNKSACLDLESYLIRLLAGDGTHEVLNRVDGIVNADYYDRARYQATFDAIFEELRRQGLFHRDIQAIKNSDLFKLSPFKELTHDQAVAVTDILEGLFDDLTQQVPSTIVVQGDPGTGKTVVAIFLIKMLMDIKHADVSEPNDGDTVFADFFVEGYPELLQGFRVGLVIPQQSLRKSVQRVFERTPGMERAMVLSPFDVGQSEERFTLLVVDETHRLNQRANQVSAMNNRRFAEINTRLFGADDPSLTQLDWITAQSDHQVFLVDSAQSVRPADLSPELLASLIDRATAHRRRYPLTSQMRVAAGAEYVSYVRRMLSDSPPEPQTFLGYDFRLFDDLGLMTRQLAAREQECGLARLVAGYAWPWRSKQDPLLHDIEIDGIGLRWNTTAVDWVSSPSAADEVGSIHTVQGYDLNYCGVIIGRDLRWDDRAGRLRFDRAQYYDKKGRENNPLRGITYSDDDLLRFVSNIYSVLLTRGIRGTFVYICDVPLRERLRDFIIRPVRLP